MEEFITLACAILYTVTVHEYSHGWVAYKLGDNTAYLQGRLTLNPLSHLDLIGTLMLIFFRFGWAKPVPINAMNFKNPKRDMMLVGIAGPLANVLSAFTFGIIFRSVGVNQIQFNISTSFVTQFLSLGIILNLALAIFNMLPVFPLDGSHILKGLLPPELAYKYSLYDRQGMIILLGILMFGYITRINIIGAIIWPPVKALANLFSGTNLLP